MKALLLVETTRQGLHYAFAPDTAPVNDYLYSPAQRKAEPTLIRDINNMTVMICQDLLDQDGIKPPIFDSSHRVSILNTSTIPFYGNNENLRAYKSVSLCGTLPTMIEFKTVERVAADCEITVSQILGVGTFI